MVTCSLEEKITTPGLAFKDNIHMPQVLAGTWQNRRTKDIAVFAVNIADEKAKYTLSFNYKEYGLQASQLNGEFEIVGEKVILNAEIEPLSCKFWEFVVGIQKYK